MVNFVLFHLIFLFHHPFQTILFSIFKSKLLHRFNKRFEVTATKLKTLAEVRALDQHLNVIAGKSVDKGTLKIGQGETLTTIRVLESPVAGNNTPPETHFISCKGLHVSWKGVDNANSHLGRRESFEALRRSAETRHLEVLIKNPKNAPKKDGNLYGSCRTGFVPINMPYANSKRKFEAKGNCFTPLPYTHKPCLEDTNFLSKIPLSLSLMESEDIASISHEVNLIEAKYTSENLINKESELIEAKQDSMKCHKFLQRLSRIQVIDIEKSVLEFASANTDSLINSCRMCSSFMQIEAKKEALRMRLERCLSILDLLRSEYHTEKSHWLEWIIIWLILVEAVLALRNFAKEMFTKE